MRRSFVTLDVFTDRRFAGNPLAVVLDAEGLDTAAMQAIAREFNHPETVFVLHAGRSRAPGAASHLHADAGTAVRRPSDRRDGGAARPARRRRRRSRLRARGGDRPGPLHARDRAATVAAAPASRSPQLPAETGPAADDATIAAALGLAPAEIGFGGFRPARWSAGNPFTFVPVAGLAAIARCRRRSRPGSMTRFPTAARTSSAARPPSRATPSMPGCSRPAFGVAEDPATGSAAAAFAGLIAARGGLADGDHAIAIEQGYEMGRPSLIRLEMAIAGGKLVSASIGGDAVIVTEGTIEA